MIDNKEVDLKIEKYKRKCNIWFMGSAVALLVNIIYSLFNPIIIITGFIVFTFGMLIYARLVLNYYLLIKHLT